MTLTIELHTFRYPNMLSVILWDFLGVRSYSHQVVYCLTHLSIKESIECLFEKLGLKVYLPILLKNVYTVCCLTCIIDFRVQSAKRFLAAFDLLRVFNLEKKTTRPVFIISHILHYKYCTLMCTKALNFSNFSKSKVNSDDDSFL